MKRTMTLTAALFVATAGSAFAASDAEVERALNKYAPQASASDVSDAEALQIVNIYHGGGTVSEKRAFIRAIVNG